MTPIIIDIEASGFGKGSYPIEVGVALADGSRHCMLIAPARAWKHWDAQAERVHGISRELLANYGRPVHEVACYLNDLLRRRTVYSDAWAFDMSWIGKLYDAADVPQAFRVADITELVDAALLPRWHETKQHVVESLGVQRHRASGDARILQETYRRVTQGAG